MPLCSIIAIFVFQLLFINKCTSLAGPLIFNTNTYRTLSSPNFMSSIVVVQCGEAANAVGSHFWNAQVCFVHRDKSLV